MKTWLITGASSGLGFALAEHVLEKGDAVMLAARRVILGSDAYKIVGAKLKASKAEYDAGRAVAYSVDLPSAPAHAASA